MWRKETVLGWLQIVSGSRPGMGFVSKVESDNRQKMGGSESLTYTEADFDRYAKCLCVRLHILFLSTYVFIPNF